MSSIVANADLTRVLSSLREATQIRDAQGKVLGLFLPQGAAPEANYEALFDLKEAEETLAMEYHAGRSLREIWSDLQRPGTHQ